MSGEKPTSAVERFVRHPAVITIASVLLVAAIVVGVFFYRVISAPIVIRSDYGDEFHGLAISRAPADGENGWEHYVAAIGGYEAVERELLARLPGNADEVLAASGRGALEPRRGDPGDSRSAQPSKRTGAVRYIGTAG